jgi:hypothetical protein
MRQHRADEVTRSRSAPDSSCSRLAKAAQRDHVSNGSTMSQAQDNDSTPQPARVPQPASIADPFWDLLAQLDYGRRQGLVRRLAVGYYEDWRPSRAEVALLVDFELGRLTEAEYLAAATRPVALTAAPDMPTAIQARVGTVAGNPTTPRANANGRASTGRGPGKPTRIATLSVDCGDVAPPFRMIVRGLTTNGWTVRGGQRYRLMTLHYVLLPPIGMAARKGQQVTPILYTAGITCIPDVTAPWADSDGRHRQHSVGSGHIVGSRGPWPVADSVRAIDFLFNRQQSVGAASAQHPAGVLRVDIAQSAATWRPIPRPTAETVNA